MLCAGKSFSGRVNPADPGQTGGSHEPVRSPSTTTSDAAVAAEQFVLQKEHEQELEQEAHAEGAGAGAGSKRKQPAPSSSPSSTLPLPLPDDESDLFDMDDETMPFATIAVDAEITPSHNNKKARAEEKGADAE